VDGLQDITLEPTRPARLSVGLDFLARRIGNTLDAGDVARTLRGLGFGVRQTGARLTLTAPSWRSTGDIANPHDIVEEVARIHGYDSLPVVPLAVELAPVRSLRTRPVSRRVRETLALRLGLQEVVTYPWVSEAFLAAAGLSSQATVRVEGMADRDCLRPSLVPNLLEAAVANLRWTSTVEIFEVGTIVHGGAYEPYDGFEAMPRQSTSLALLMTGADGALLFRRGKGLVDRLTRLGHLAPVRLGDGGTAPWADASARLAVHSGGTAIGTLGLLTKRCRRLAGLDATHVVCLELDLGPVAAAASRDNTYVPVPELPGAQFDLSVVVADAVTWASIEAAARDGDALVTTAEFVDEFRGSWVPAGHRCVTLRVSLQAPGATLTSETIGARRTAILHTLATRTGAHLRQ
jgi:phenylalanyl-tRNA synthetase beta chain